jgi:hypothetical protein
VGSRISFESRFGTAAQLGRSGSKRACFQVELTSSTEFW